MKDFEKRINTKNGLLIYTVKNEYSCHHRISYIEFIDKENRVIKQLSFCMWDDFCFYARKTDEKFDENNKLEDIEFDIDKDNPLYTPLKKFLKEDEIFCLDDDDTSEINAQTMQIYNEDETIKIVFRNELEKEKIINNSDLILNKHKVFIKNIGFDPRSKLDVNNPTKDRLFHLFRSFEEELIPKQVIENCVMSYVDLDFKNMEEKLRKILDPKERIFTIIPELRSEDGFKQKHPHHIYDVWEHTLKALKNSEEDLEVRLALLLHDIGKPHSYIEGEDGVRHFPGHAEKSEEISRKVLTRLEYNEEEVNRICFLIANHDTIIDVNNVNLENKDLMKKLLHIQYCDAKAHAPEHIEKRIKKLDEINKQLELKIKELEEKGEER